MFSNAQLYGMLQRIQYSNNLPKAKLQVILTKDSIKALLGAEVEFTDIKPGSAIQQTDMFFDGYRVYLGGQDKIQIVESEIWL